MTKSPHMSRREFVTIVVGVLGAIITAVIGFPAIGYLFAPAMRTQKTDAWVPVGPLENYPIGEPTLFTFVRTTVNGWERTANSYGVYVYRETQDRVITYSNLCTHLSCRVTWKDEEQAYICPCHDGIFNVDGQVTAGPPPRALYEYPNKIEEDTLYVQTELI